MTRRVMRLLLALTPSSFRDRYGEEILEVRDARVAACGSPIRRIPLAAREISGLAWTVVRLRLGASVREPSPGNGDGSPPPFDTLRRDVTFGLRTLRRSPGFTLAALAMLAIGIGANSAIFSAVNAFLLRPLPFADADRVVMLYETNPEFGWTHAQVAPANALDWRAEVGAFEDVAVYSESVDDRPFVRDGEPELLGVSFVSGNFFSVLGVQPQHGRGFAWDETWEGSGRVAVLSHAAFTTRFGADPGVVGRTIAVGPAEVEIVGVMPPDFTYPSENIDLWTPWAWARDNREAAWFRRAHFARAVARLSPGVTREEAAAELELVVSRLQRDYPETNRVMGAGLMQIRDFLVMDVRAPLYVLLGAVVLLLVLACTNVANLVLVRASDRSREFALRLALGAGRSRVARQMLTEGLLLSLAGGAMGLGIGWLGVRAIATRQAVGIEGATALALDLRVVGFTLAAALASALLFGMMPSWRAARSDVNETLKEGGRGGSEGRRGLRAASTLVVAQVALTLLLVVGAGLMIRTFVHLRDVNPGFTTESVYAVQFAAPSARYGERDAVLAFQDEFMRRLEARPGVDGVGSVGRLPLDGTSWSSQFQAEGWPPDRVGFEILHRRADAGYFDALSIPLVRGRMFGPADGPDAPLVVLINETFAREHFPGEDPIGQRIAYDRAAGPESNWYEIIGIVGDQLQVSPGQPPRAEVFEHRRQDWSRDTWYVIRTSGDVATAAEAAKSVLAELDPLIPVADVRSLREVWRSSMAREEFLLTLLGVFAGAALLLAAVGVYGVTAQAVRKRTREIRIRMALGAVRSDVIRMVLAHGLVIIGLGLAVGMAAALVATRALGSFLYGVEPTDPFTLTVVAGLLALVAAIACVLPARRATAVDPASSLRLE